ncbi:MAG: hypothetical protein AAGK78_13065, partial [Planctomycetota bacterium]
MGFNLSDRLVFDPRFNRLALGVHDVQSFSERRALLGAFRRQQRKRQTRMTDAPCDVDPWTEQKPKMIDAGRALDARPFAKRFKTGIAPRAGHFQPLGNENASKTRHRHHVANKT